MNSFCERLKVLRKQTGLNQTAFGALAGVTKETQLKYENGARKPDIDYIQALYEAKVDVFYLVTGEHSESTLDKSETTLLDGFRSLDEKGKAGVLALILGLSPKPTIENKFEGDVGQVVHGNITSEQTFTFHSGKKKK